LGLEGLGLAIWAGVSNQIKPTTEEVVLEDFAFETVRVDRQGAIIERSNGNAQVFSEALGNGVTLEMVLIPGGTFTMGSPSDEAMRVNNEGPQHEVTVPEFYLGKYAVTQAQWEAVMGNNPSRFKGSNRPVEQVSWRDATEFCQKLSERTGRSYRLPSEAEWEYACRAGTTTPFHFGETITTDLVNFWGYFSISYVGGPEIVYRGEFPGETTDVGSFEVANAFGLYDMHGNVFEWCEDHWHNNYEGALTDGSTWLSENDDDSHSIARGGSWDYITRECRSAYRHRDFPFQDDVIEFRVVCVAPRTH
jgi:formylglycine-generating enzyme required for sulfatase activity